jgi:hypothetical protein
MNSFEFGSNEKEHFGSRAGDLIDIRQNLSDLMGTSQWNKYVIFHKASSRIGLAVLWPVSWRSGLRNVLPGEYRQLRVYPVVR